MHYLNPGSSSVYICHTSLLCWWCGYWDQSWGLHKGIHRQKNALCQGRILADHRDIRPNVHGHICGSIISLLNNHVFYRPFVGKLHVKLEWTYIVCYQWVTKFGSDSCLPRSDMKTAFPFYFFLCISYSLVCYIIFLF